MSPAETMTGGQALAAQLALEGVSLVFGVPGVQLDHAIDGLARLDGRVRFWNVRHEQAASYMADGFARGGGDFGTCMVVPGPGLLNAAAGIATAYACSSRVLVLAGQLPSHAIGQGRGMLHEIPDQSGLLASLTKWSAMARSPAEIPGLVRSAVRALHSGRPRPAGLEIPPDVLAATAQVRLVDPGDDNGELLRPDPVQVAAAAALLARASRPVVVAGGGVLAARASVELEQLADKLNAPVVMTRNGRGSLSDRHPMALGPLGLNPALAATDAVLVVGSRLAGPSGRSPALPDGAALITVNADAADARRDNRATLAVVADARAFLGAIVAELDSKPRADTSARWLVERIRLEADKHLAGLEPQMEYLRVLRSAIPDDGVLVNELTQVGYVAGLGYPVWQAGTFITPGYEGTLGYGFPTALGVKAADPRRAVVSITGDGGFGWGMQELATARRYGIGVVTVLFNNDAFANVRRTQLEEFSGRVLGSELTNPDFVALAESFGVRGTRADGPAELAGALREAITGTDPVLIEVPLPDCPSPWALIQRGIPANP
jgi:acetolactate synthase I/II/III large subunit